MSHQLLTYGQPVTLVARQPLGGQRTWEAPATPHAQRTPAVAARTLRVDHLFEGTTVIAARKGLVMTRFIKARWSRALLPPVMLAATLGTVPAIASPAGAAAGPVTISVQATPNPVATGQAVAYTVTVSNVGSDTVQGVGHGDV